MGSEAASKSKKMGLNAVWSMAVGGMIGGGIFSVLGVVVEHAGGLAWVAFVVGGLIAGATAHSYAALSKKFREGGGAFTFLRDTAHDEWAASVSWVLLVGYVLTMAVYAFTFGHYLAHVFGFGAGVVPRVAAAVVLVGFTGLNLRGVGASALAEVIMVWGKVIVLVALAAFGLATFAPERLSEGIGPVGPAGVAIGAASVFMAYEGFQLLAYDYDDIEAPDRTLPLGLYLSVGAVIVIYIAVALGTASLVGADALVEKKEIALAEAGRAAAGTVGMVVVSIAAVLSTGSAINATLFATARLAKRVAEDDELPGVLARENSKGSPIGSVIALGTGAAVLAVIGSLSQLVEAASLSFLGTFGVVNWVAFRAGAAHRLVAALGCLGAGAAFVVLGYQLATTEPLVLGAFGVVVIVAVFGRPWILRRVGGGDGGGKKSGG